MSKKKDKIREHDIYVEDKNIIEMELDVACTDSMQIFFANSNLMRQISNLIDGLKPVQRRILLAMKDLDLTPRKTVKSAKIVSETMSTYHPHGDASIYGTLCKFNQWWSTRHLLARPVSSFGSQAGGSAPAMRYTDTTISEFAVDAYFTEYNIDNVLSKPTYDRSGSEPEYLPAKYPMALLLGCFGIGQGIQVGIPSFRPDMVFDKAIEVLDDPNFDDPLLLPDAATFANVIDDGQFEEFCRTGIGKIRYQGVIEIDRDKNRIFIKSIPPQVTMETIEKNIIELYKNNILKGYVDIIDYNDISLSPWDGAAARIVKFRRETDMDEAARILLKYTGLTKTISVNFVYLDNYREVTYGVLDYLREWIDYRREFKQISYSKNLVKTVGRMHHLEILLHIFKGKNAEKALKIARTSKKETLIKYLMDEFNISSLQAKGIAGMSISSFTDDSMNGFQKEYEDLIKYRDELKKLLNSPKKIDKIIRKELLEGKAKYGNDIRSKIITVESEGSIVNTKHMMVFTKDGYVKKLPHDIGSVGTIETGDIPIDVSFVKNRDDLMIFDSVGKVYKLPVSKIPNSNLDERGSSLSEFIKLKGTVKAIIPKPTKDFHIEPGTNFIVAVTSNGIIKKTDITEYQSMRNELIAINVDKGDEVVDVKIMIGDRDLVVYTENGMGNRFNTEEIRDTGRATRGILAITKENNDRVKGFIIVGDKDKFIVCVTNKGKAKKSTLNNFKTMKRNSQALRLITLDPNETITLMETIVGKEELAVFMLNEAIRIHTADIETLPRMSKGVKKIPVKRGNMIVGVRVDK